MSVAKNISELTPEQYRDFFDNTQDMLYVMDADCVVIGANRALQEGLGYSDDKLIGVSCWDFIHPEADMRVNKEAWRVLEKTGRIDGFETRWRRLDGSAIDISLDVKAAYDSNGNFTCAYVITRDITKRKQLEAELRESDGRYRRIVETANEGIWTIDAEGVTTFVNARMAEMMGYNVDDMVGKPLFSFLDREGREIIEKRLERRRKGMRDQYEFHLICKDGSDLWTLMETSPLTDKDGRYAGSLAMITDINKRKKAQDELREQERAYKALFSRCPDGILVADVETKEFKYANPRACQMFRYEEEDICKLGVADLHPNEDLPSVFAEFEALARGEKALAESIPCLRNDGTIFSADISSAPAVIDGQDCLIGFFRDITESKQMKEELQRARYELEERVEERTSELSKTVTRLKLEIKERQKAEHEVEEQAQTLQALFEESFDGIVVADAETRQIEYVNRASCQIFGYTKDEMQGMGIADLHPKEDLPRVFAEFDAQVKCEKALAESVPCLRKDKKVFHADINSTIAIIRSRRCFVGFYSDITDRE